MGLMIEKNEPFRFTIYGQPATKKNSSTIVRGRSVLLPSKAYRLYESRFHRQLMDMRQTMEIPHYHCPVELTCFYWLESRAHWPDLIGLEQATADIMSDQYKTVDHKRQLHREWILSDDRIIKSWDGSRIVGIDKTNPRVEVTVTPLEIEPDEQDPYILKMAAEHSRLF